MRNGNEIHGAVIGGGSSLIATITGWIPAGDLEGALFVSALCTITGFILTKILNGIYATLQKKAIPAIKAFFTQRIKLK